MIQMHGHPTLGVKNAKPRLSSKPGPKIGKLSEEYLRVRNEQMRTKNLAAQNRLPEGVRTRKCQNCPALLNLREPDNFSTFVFSPQQLKYFHARPRSEHSPTTTRIVG
jgi:hypothetical protein